MISIGRDFHPQFMLTISAIEPLSSELIFVGKRTMWNSPVNLRFLLEKNKVSHLALFHTMQYKNDDNDNDYHNHNN